MAHTYNKKIVVCGNVVEIYDYSEKILKGYSNKIEKEKREQTDEVKKENYARSIKRTKRTIRELVNCNFHNSYSSFLTLTFKDNITDYDIAFNFWKRFKQKVEYHYKIKLSYLGVVEFQKRGAIHFHICLFNVPYLEHSRLYGMWNSVCPGGVYIERVNTDTCDNVGAYVTKYITKDSEAFFDNEYKGKKRYFSSRNLNKPIVEELDTVAHKDHKEYYERFINNFKDNIVFECTSSPFVLTKKEEVVKEVEELKEFYQDSLICNDSILLDYEEGFTQKKELVETVQSTQQVTYTQILMNINTNKRDKQNKYIRYNNINSDNNKVIDIKKII